MRRVCAFARVSRVLKLSCAASVATGFLAIAPQAMAQAEEGASVAEVCSSVRALPNRNWSYAVTPLARVKTYSFENAWPGRHAGDVHAELYETTAAPTFTCTPTNRGGNTSLEDHPRFVVEVGSAEKALIADDMQVCRNDGAGNAIATEANNGAFSCDVDLSNSFAPVEDFAVAGLYTPIAEAGGSTCTIFRPATLESHVRHPIVIWGNGTGATPASYQSLLLHLASHGFVVGAANTTNAGTGVDMLNCLGFLEQQNAAVDGPLARKLNIYRVGTSGHSQGGGGSIMAGRDARIGATAPMQPYVLGLGYQAGAASLQNGPMFLMSGSADTIASPTLNQRPVFNAANVPVFWGTLQGASHFEPVASAGRYRGPVTAWFRSQLMLDTAASELFYGNSCGLCTSADWVVNSKGL